MESSASEAANLNSGMDHGAEEPLDDWQLLPKDWWSTPYSQISWSYGKPCNWKKFRKTPGRYARPPPYHDSLFRSRSQNGVALQVAALPASNSTQPDRVDQEDGYTDGLELNGELAGVQMTEVVLRKYESDVGFHAPELVRRHAALAPAADTTETGHAAAAPPPPPWDVLMADLFGEHDRKDLSSFVSATAPSATNPIFGSFDPDCDWPDMASSLGSLPSLSSAEMANSSSSSMSFSLPPTPRPSSTQSIIGISSSPSNSTFSTFTFPTLNPQPIAYGARKPSPAHSQSFKLRKDSQGFYSPDEDDATPTSKNLAPPFVPEQSRLRTKPTSKTRAIVDQLRQRPHSAADSRARAAPSASLSRTSADLKTPMTLEADAEGWISMKLGQGGSATSSGAGTPPKGHTTASPPSSPSSPSSSSSRSDNLYAALRRHRSSSTPVSLHEQDQDEDTTIRPIPSPPPLSSSSSTSLGSCESITKDRDGWMRPPVTPPPILPVARTKVKGSPAIVPTTKHKRVTSGSGPRHGKHNSQSHRQPHPHQQHNKTPSQSHPMVYSSNHPVPPHHLAHPQHMYPHYQAPSLVHQTPPQMFHPVLQPNYYNFYQPLPTAPVPFRPMSQTYMPAQMGVPVTTGTIRYSVPRLQGPPQPRQPIVIPPRGMHPHQHRPPMPSAISS